MKITKVFKSTFFWIVTFLLILAVCFCVIYFNKKSNGELVVVYVEDEVYLEIPLENDGEYPMKTDFGENILEIKDKKIRIKSADCVNQICVSDGWVSECNKPVICAPHHLSVIILSEKSQTDA